MTMVAANAPRRLYARSGSLVLLFGGVYFGPKSNEESGLTAEDQVTVEVLKKAGGKSRVQVTQVGAGGKAIVETWTQKELVFKKREPKTA